MIEKQIYYHDTDAGGIVYYANYLKYLEEARTQYFEARGLGVRSFLDRGLLYAVRSCNIVYKSPARYGDIIVADARVEAVTGARIVFVQTVVHKTTGRVLAEAEIVLVCLTREFRPCPLPEEIRGALV